MGTATGLLLALGLALQPVHAGVSWSESRMASKGPLAAVNAVVAVMDPTRLQLHLDLAAADYGMRAAWTTARMPPHAVVAFNAGQFIGGIPWGWLVLDGIEQKPPGSGSLAMSFVIDHSGRAALVTRGEISSVRADARFAFQSYPALLVGGEMPWELQAPGRGIDLLHRDSRLAIGIRRNGEIIVVLTRFAAVGSVAGSLPWGPTVPEMAAFMRSLGAERAMMLDGGISSQLAIRKADGVVKHWANWRPVPLAVIATAPADVARRSERRQTATRTTGVDLR
jgi:exopolysaccharide biosynthesis protein